MEPHSTSSSRSSSRRLHSSWDSIPTTQSTNHRTEHPSSPRLDRQQPIIIQNFELLKPNQLKFKRKSLSTANLYLSQASLHRQGTTLADHQMPRGDSSSTLVQNRHHGSSPDSSNNVKHYSHSAFSNKNQQKSPRHFSNSTGKSTTTSTTAAKSSPSKQKRVTFSASNTLHRYEPKQEEHYKWANYTHDYDTDGYGWYRQRDFLYPESHDSSGRRSHFSNNGSNRELKILNNNVNIPIRMLLHKYNFGGVKNSNKIRDENDNVYNNLQNHNRDADVDSNGQYYRPHTVPCTGMTNAATPGPSPADMNDHSSTPSSQWVNNGQATHSTWSRDRGQLDCNSTTLRGISGLADQHSGHRGEPELDSSRAGDNNDIHDTLNHQGCDVRETNGGDHNNIVTNEQLYRNDDRSHPKEAMIDAHVGVDFSDDNDVSGVYKDGNSKHYMQGVVTPAGSSSDVILNDEYDGVIKYDIEKNNSNKSRVNSIDFPAEDAYDDDDDERASIIANPDGDGDNDGNYLNDKEKSVSASTLQTTNGVKTKSRIAPNETKISHHSIPVSTFYDAFQEYDYIESEGRTKLNNTFHQNNVNHFPVTNTKPNLTPSTTFRPKTSPNGNAPFPQKNTSNTVEKSRIIRLNFLKDTNPGSVSKNSSDSTNIIKSSEMNSHYNNNNNNNNNNSNNNNNNSNNKQEGSEVEVDMAITGLQLRSDNACHTNQKESQHLSSSASAAVSQQSTTPRSNLKQINGRPISRGDMNAQFLMNFYSSSGERKSDDDSEKSDHVVVTSAPSSQNNYHSLPRDRVKRVSFDSDVIDGSSFDYYDPVTHSLRGREMERKMFSSTTTPRSRARKQPMGHRSRSASSTNFLVSGNGILAKGDKPSVKETVSGKCRLHSAERFLLKTRDTQVVGRTALNHRLEELVVSRSLSSRVRLTMERARSNMT